jgi:hypothetical protein
MSRLIRFSSFLIVAIAAVSPFFGPTLIKHGVPQETVLLAQLVLGFPCGTLLGYLVSKQVVAVQNQA